MWQVILSGYANNPSITNTEYAAPWGRDGNTWVTTENNRRQMVPGTGRVHTFGVELTALTGGNGYDMTIRKNGAATAVTVNVGDTSRTALYAGDPVDFAAGDYMTIECNPDSPTNARRARWFFIWEDDDENQTIFMAGHTNTLTTGSQTEENNMCAGEVWNTTFLSIPPDFSRQTVTIPGTIRDFYVETSADPNPGQYTFRIRENGNNSGLQATVTSGNTTANDTVNTQAIAANNDLDVTCAAASSPASAYAWWGCVFEPDNVYKSSLPANSRNALNLSNGAIEYNYIWCGEETWVSNQNTRKSTISCCWVSDFRVELNQALPVGTDVQFWVRRNNTDTALTVTINAGSTTVAANESVVEFDDFDEIQIKSEATSSGLPAGTWAARWGVSIQVVKPFPDSQMMLGVGI